MEERRRRVAERRPPAALPRRTVCAVSASGSEQLLWSHDDPHASLDSALDTIGFGCFHVVSIPAICLAIMGQSLQTNMLSYLQPCVSAPFSLSPSQPAILGAANFLGSIISTPLFGILADTHGRRFATQLSVLIMAICGATSALSPTFATLCLLQGAVGFGMGGAMIPFDLLSELSPRSVRGAVTNISAWFWAFGTLYMMAMAASLLGGAAGQPAAAAQPIHPSEGARETSFGGSEASFGEPWRLFVFAGSLPLLLAAALLPCLTESPYWLLEHGEHQQALTVLTRMASRNGMNPVHWMTPTQMIPTLEGSMLPLTPHSRVAHGVHAASRRLRRLVSCFSPMSGAPARGGVRAGVVAGGKT